MRVARFTVRITTGAAGISEPPRFCFNGHVLPFEQVQGSTGPHERFEGSFEPRSFAHHLTLEGPVAGSWEIQRIDVVYEIEGREPYEVHLGGVTLDGDTCADIWRERPLDAFDV